VAGGPSAGNTNAAPEKATVQAVVPASVQLRVLATVQAAMRAIQVATVQVVMRRQMATALVRVCPGKILPANQATPPQR